MFFRFMILFSKFRIWPLVMPLGLVMLASGGIGCRGGAKPSSQDPEAAHLVKVSDLVQEYKTAHQDNPPGDIEELKNWAIKEGKAEEKDFISTRDKQPYEIVVSPGGGKPKKGAPLMVREAVGKDGMKFQSTPGSGVASPLNQGVFEYMGGEGMRSGKPKSGMPDSLKQKG
jgi:hypothetical protein